jgi:hypothetical protein
VTLVNGGASLNVATFTTGSHSITVSYGGNSKFSPSSSTLTQTVNPAPTTTVATVSPNPSVFGQFVTITATLTSSAGTPAGAVSFLDGGTILGTGSLNGSGQGSFSASALAAGSHTITATYAANGNFAGSTSAALLVTVNKASTTTVVTAQTPNPSVAGQPVSVSFTVKAVSPGNGTPTGNVTVSDGAGDSCTATVAAGGCSVLLATAGTKTLTAAYVGASNFNSSSSTGIAHTVRDFLISVTPNSQSLKPGQKTTYKLTLAPSSGFAGSISLSCTGLPASSTCSFVPASVSLSGSGSVGSTVTVQTGKSTPKGAFSLTFTGIYGSGIPATGGLMRSTKTVLTIQ